jgi:protein TIF31
MEAAGFLTESVASRFIRECIQLTVTPTDGEALKTALHTRGINVRYLGFIAQIAEKRDDLRHLMVRGRERGEEDFIRYLFPPTAPVHQ